MEADWSDITPIPQDDGPNPIVSIAYSPSFRAKMDIFRAVLKSGELSDRVLELTEDILNENAANYTVWQYRRECLRFLRNDLSLELDFMDTFAEENPKNYQIWYHRRAIVEELLNHLLKPSEEQAAATSVSDNEDTSSAPPAKKQCSDYDPEGKVTLLSAAARELVFTGVVFETDAKNYHAWAHRQWVLQSLCQPTASSGTINPSSAGPSPSASAVKDSGSDGEETTKLWAEELEYIDLLLGKDIRNNSVWNQRWFVVHNTPGAQPISASVLQRELNYAFNLLEKAKKNESAWNYVRGYSRKYPEALPFIISKCMEIEPSLQVVDEEAECDNPFVLSLMADLREQEGTLVALQYTELMLMRLFQVDKIRIKYWQRRVEKTRMSIRLLNTVN